MYIQRTCCARDAGQAIWYYYMLEHTNLKFLRLSKFRGKNLKCMHLLELNLKKFCYTLLDSFN